MMLSARLLFFFLIVIFPLNVFADSWMGPVTSEEFSESREFFVRVTPGESIGDTFGFAGAKKGAFAKAELYRRGKEKSYELESQWDLVNPVAPVNFFVSDSGALITFDNWHNMGYGKVVAIYNNRGQLIQSITLEDMYPQQLLEKISRSVSSRWWRGKINHFINNQMEFYVSDTVGGNFIFNMKSGAFKYTKMK
jgi:hypothetical protein